MHSLPHVLGNRVFAWHTWNIQRGARVHVTIFDWRFQHGSPDDEVEVAELLRVPESWVYTRTAPKCTPALRLPHLKIGRYLRFERAKVVEWMAKHEQNGHESLVVGVSTRRQRISHAFTDF